MDIKKLKEDLKGIYSEYNQIFELRKKQNYQEICDGLNPYEIKPDPKNIKNFKGDTKEYLTKDLAKLREKALTITESALKEINAAKTEAPTQEAVNYISLLGSRRNLTEADINNAFEQYGGNYACFKALEDIANDRRLPVNYSNNAEAIETAVQTAQHSFEKIGVPDCENGHASAGSIAFQSMFIDSMPE